MEAILIVLPSPDRLPSLLSAIRAAGAPGATVYDSQGQEFLSWLGAYPAMARHWSVEGTDRETGKTVLAIVPDEVKVAVIAAAERVLDGFASPYAGMLCTWPIGEFRCYQGRADERTAVRP
jgi:hypothetical protein